MVHAITSFPFNRWQGREKFEPFERPKLAAETADIELKQSSLKHKLYPLIDETVTQLPCRSQVKVKVEINIVSWSEFINFKIMFTDRLGSLSN